MPQRASDVEDAPPGIARADHRDLERPSGLVVRGDPMRERCPGVAVRFADPRRFRQVLNQTQSGNWRRVSCVEIGLVSGFAGVGGGIMTNIVMSLSGLSMHKSIGRAAAAGVVVGAPATIVAALSPNSGDAAQLGSINLPIWACIAPAQAGAAWIGAHLAQRTSANALSRVFAVSLAATGILMLRASLAWR